MQYHGEHAKKIVRRPAQWETRSNIKRSIRFWKPMCAIQAYCPKVNKRFNLKKKKVSEPTTSFSKQKYQLRDLYKCFKQPQDYAYDQITVIKIIKKKKKVEMIILIFI